MAPAAGAGAGADTVASAGASNSGNAATQPPASASSNTAATPASSGPKPSAPTSVTPTQTAPIQSRPSAAPTSTTAAPIGRVSTSVTAPPLAHKGQPPRPVAAKPGALPPTSNGKTVTTALIASALPAKTIPATSQPGGIPPVPAAAPLTTPASTAAAARLPYSLQANVHQYPHGYGTYPPTYPPSAPRRYSTSAASTVSGLVPVSSTATSSATYRPATSSDGTRLVSPYAHPYYSTPGGTTYMYSPGKAYPYASYSYAPTRLTTSSGTYIVRSPIQLTHTSAASSPVPSDGSSAPSSAKASPAGSRRNSAKANGANAKKTGSAPSTSAPSSTSVITSAAPAAVSGARPPPIAIPATGAPITTAPSSLGRVSYVPPSGLGSPLPGSPQPGSAPAVLGRGRGTAKRPGSSESPAGSPTKLIKRPSSGSPITATYPPPIGAAAYRTTYVPISSPGTYTAPYSYSSAVPYASYANRKVSRSGSPGMVAYASPVAGRTPVGSPLGSPLATTFAGGTPLPTSMATTLTTYQPPMLGLTAKGKPRKRPAKATTAKGASTKGKATTAKRAAKGKNGPGSPSAPSHAPPAAPTTASPLAIPATSAGDTPSSIVAAASETPADVSDASAPPISNGKGQAKSKANTSKTKASRSRKPRAPKATTGKRKSTPQPESPSAPDSPLLGSESVLTEEDLLDLENSEDLLHDPEPKRRKNAKASPSRGRGRARGRATARGRGRGARGQATSSSPPKVGPDVSLTEQVDPLLHNEPDVGRAVTSSSKANGKAKTKAKAKGVSKAPSKAGGKSSRKSATPTSGLKDCLALSPAGSQGAPEPLSKSDSKQLGRTSSTSSSARRRKQGSAVIVMDDPEKMLHDSELQAALATGATNATAASLLRTPEAEDEWLVPRPVPQKPVPDNALRKVEVLEAIGHLHDEVIAYDKRLSQVFLKPVDTKLFTSYLTVVQHPMDLSVISRKIHDQEYNSIWEYVEDMHLMINNCLLFNPKQSSFHHKYALDLREFWEPKLEHTMLVTLAHHRYCCGKRRQLSPEIFRCRGGTCFIQHGSTYFECQYSDEDHIVYCQAHFTKLQDEFTIPRFGNGTGPELELSKSMFKKAKHNAPLVSEKFVECIRCSRQDHEVCVVKDPYDELPYTCHHCREGWPVGQAAPEPGLLTATRDMLAVEARRRQAAAAKAGVNITVETASAPAIAKISLRKASSESPTAETASPHPVSKGSRSSATGRHRSSKRVASPAPSTPTQAVAAAEAKIKAAKTGSPLGLSVLHALQLESPVAADPLGVPELAQEAMQALTSPSVDLGAMLGLASSPPALDTPESPSQPPSRASKDDVKSELKNMDRAPIKSTALSTVITKVKDEPLDATVPSAPRAHRRSSSASSTHSGSHMTRRGAQREAVSATAHELPIANTHGAIRARTLPESQLAREIKAELVKALPQFAEHVVVRTVNHAREVAHTKHLYASYFPDAPTDFPYTRKVILAFLDLGHVDVLFYGFIIHEYGPDAPEPDTRRIYISLLDSVKMPKMLLPSHVRTDVYHTLFRGYLRVCARRGFTHAHIFTCPPRRGQNYIFPFKPASQREICVTRLRQWYENLLDSCMFRRDPCVVDVMTLDEGYPGCTLTDLPYFDGDNWPDILEDIIKYEEDAMFEVARQQYMSQVVNSISEAFAKYRETLKIQYTKPGDGGGFYKGHPPASLPPHKSRKKRVPTGARVLGLDRRLDIVIQSTHRDFLVVKLMNQSTEYIPDPDADFQSAQTGEDHSIVSFLKAERLEFSSLRHNCFSTTCLLHLLLAQDKVLPPRYPEAPVQQDQQESASRRESIRRASLGQRSHEGSPLRVTLQRSQTKT